MKNYDVSPLVDSALNDPQVKARLKELAMSPEYHRFTSDPTAQQDYLMLASFIRGVEYGAGSALNALIHMAKVTDAALSTIRETIPLLDEGPAYDAVVAALKSAYDQNKGGREIAKSLAITNLAGRSGVPVQLIQQFLDGPRGRMDYMRVGVLALQNLPSYYGHFVIVRKSRGLSAMTCHCESCMKSAALSGVMADPSVINAQYTEQPMDYLVEFGELLINTLREAIEAVDTGDIRVGHEPGEGSLSAEELLRTVMKQSRG